MKQEEREQFFSDQGALGSTWYGLKGMTAQYINECVDKRNGMEVADNDGEIWGWVYDCHKDVGKWVIADTHERRVKDMSEGRGGPALLPDYEPYQYVQVSGYNPAEWKDPGNLPEGQEWCEDCGEGHPTENDPVNPDHYRSHPSGVECIQITEHMNFNLGNTIKYVWRAGLKTEDPAEDIKKALWYLRRELSRIEAES